MKNSRTTFIFIGNTPGQDTSAAAVVAAVATDLDRMTYVGAPEVVAALRKKKTLVP